MRLAYGDFVVEVGAPAATLRWLRDFLDGPFAETDAPAAQEVQLFVDASGYAGFASGAGAPVECFTLDGEFRALPAHRAPDGGLVLHDARSRVALSVGEGKVMVSAEEEGFPARLVLLRAVRELATTHALRRGWLHLHAAAVETRGRICAFAGPRRSGKSTLLLHTMLAGGARFVANDRVFVDPSADPPAARGMPTLVRLREDSVERFAGLGARLRGRGYDRAYSLEEAVLAPVRETFPSSVTPAQLCALTGAAACGAGPLGALFFPAVDDGHGYGISPLPAAEATRRLGKSLLLAGLPERPAAAFAGEEPAPLRTRADLDALCAALAERVPCFALRLGADAYAKGVWDAIVQAF